MAAAVALGGCSTGSSGSSSSSVTAVGHTLDIFISEPTNIVSDPAQLDVVDAERLAFKQESGEVKHYGLRLIVVRRSELSANARAAIQDQSSIAYLGELAPGATELTAGITNALDLLTVSATDNALELTQATPAVANAPTRYYESLGTYGHTFARVVPSSDQEAAFDAHAIALLGGPVYVANDGSDYGRALAHALTSAAPRFKLAITSTESSAKAVFFAAASPSVAAHFLNDAATSAPSAHLFGPSALATPGFAAALSASTRARTFLSVPGFKPSSLDAAGVAFRRAFAAAYGHEPSTEAIFGFAAMSAVLHVIALEGINANSRAKVVKAFLSITRLQPSVLGPYSIDKSGNTNLSSFVLVRPGGG